jgi:hypothetical protein
MHRDMIAKSDRHFDILGMCPPLSAHLRTVLGAPRPEVSPLFVYVNHGVSEIRRILESFALKF